MSVILIGTVYLYIGAAVAVPFLLFGLGRIDENAQDAWIFRPLLIPGVLLIWPLVLWRDEKHRRLAKETGKGIHSFAIFDALGKLAPDDPL